MTVPAFPGLGPGSGDGGNTSASPVRVAARGSYADPSGRPGSFTGTYTLEKFVLQDEHLAAAGIIAGRLRDSGGADQGVTSRRVTVAVRAAATPVAVDVEIGPLEVNLSGLRNHLDPIALHIAPHPEWGNLGGLLLSALSHPLEQTVAGQRLVELLNALLSILALPTFLDPPGPAPTPPRSR